MERRRLRTWGGIALLVVALALAHFVAGMGEGVAMLAPALALLATLLAGRYLGEEAIDRVRRTRRAPSARRAGPARPVLRGAVRHVPRGGLLLASSLATRPPPLTV